MCVHVRVGCQPEAVFDVVCPACDYACLSMARKKQIDIFTSAQRDRTNLLTSNSVMIGNNAQFNYNNKKCALATDHHSFGLTTFI